MYTPRCFWLLGFEGQRHWPGLCRALTSVSAEARGWADDTRFADGPSRAKHSEELVRLLDAVFAGRDLAEWAATFDEHKVLQRRHCKAGTAKQALRSRHCEIGTAK